MRTIALILAGSLIAIGVWPRATVPEPSHRPVTKRTSVPTTRPIEQLRVGQRVLGHNPDRSEGEAVGDTAVDPATWRLVKLRAEERYEDGAIDDINIETLQSPEWLADHQVTVGGEAPIPLDLVEMGLRADLRAKVLAIEPCPPIQHGPGRVVLTTVNHLNNYVFELTMESADGRRETVRPTGPHKFYQPQTQAWVSTDHLHVGDVLQSQRGRVTVVSVRQLPGTHRVYNMTVEREHVYYVSHLAALTHNMCPPTANDPLYKIDDGVRRSKSAEMTGAATVPARVKRLGQPDELMDIPLGQLRSPKGELPLDDRFLNNNLQKAIEGTRPPPIEVVPIPTERPGLVPIPDVRLVPPRG